LTTAVFSAAVPPFVDGIRAAMRLDAGLAVIGLLIAIAFVGGRLWRAPHQAGQGRRETE
jgi:ABC-type proline/glycine betaine transport system permease subunit